ncbi:MAG: glutamine-hydrolyzing GMP synthase [Anaerolineae bacterium]|nr:glutamine-hydrolyzing GMP synthase [Anaerolineae bacterium]MCX8068017.1 glutamine-hydrolyzing GMP synthase [Anaerolineae bacterium]MDW7992907.1 glutamine-hydrolyzing GMP synthase [Anaerolineae bacterium]
MRDTLVILDYGSQTTQLIARRIRESQVYCELFPWNTPAERVMALRPRGFVLSGGPASVYEPGAPTLPAYVLESGRPVLGICYGMQLLAHALGGRVGRAPQREYGPARVELIHPLSFLIPLQAQPQVWMSHGDRVEELPPGFIVLARSLNSPVAAMGDPDRHLYGVQFHPEVVHTPAGREILRRFATEVCGCAPTWTPAAFIEEAIASIREQVGDGRVLCALSGGVDSAVTATLVHRAIGDQLTCVFVNTGLMRRGEPEQVVRTFRDRLGMPLVAVDATEEFLAALEGVTDPEEKRRIVGEKFIRVFEREAEKLGRVDFLAQGTLYPDVIESAAPDRPGARRIKTHHNVGGLPERMRLRLIEPLRYLFKDEARAVGEALGLPPEVVWRQPFPGPGLAVRVVGAVTWERLERLRAADAILLEELDRAGLLRTTQQAFAVLLPVRSVGVMGDCRTYEEVIALRVVTTEDFMTADWARLDPDLLARISNRIVNEVAGVNRVVYDITSKPPATIEWE